MKISKICLFIIFLLAVSCTKSRFATTTRHYHNGKVTYSNHYSNEWRSPKLHKRKRAATITPPVLAKTARNQVDNPDPKNKMNPIASTDKNFLILNNMGNQVSQNTKSSYPEHHNKKELTFSQHPSVTLPKDHATVPFKKLLKGDSSSVKKSDTIKENGSGIEKMEHPKTEKLGLIGFILSFLGIIPLIGIPFAVLAIIFGATSLKRINRNPEKYKGKGFAIASILIGTAMLVTNIIITAASIHSVSSSTQTWHAPSTSCKV